MAVARRWDQAAVNGRLHGFAVGGEGQVGVAGVVGAVSLRPRGWSCGPGCWSCHRVMIAALSTRACQARASAASSAGWGCLLTLAAGISFAIVSAGGDDAGCSAWRSASGSAGGLSGGWESLAVVGGIFGGVSMVSTLFNLDRAHVAL